MSEEGVGMKEAYLNEEDDVGRVFAEIRLSILDNLKLSELYHRAKAVGEALVEAQERFLNLKREATVLGEKVADLEMTVLREAFFGGVIQGKNKEEREFLQAALLAGKLEDYTTPALVEYLQLRKALNEKNLAVSDARDALTVAERRLEALKPLLKIAESLSRLAGA